MIGNCYTGRVKEENGKFYTYKPLKVFGNEPWEIEISEPDMTFEEMLNDEEMFVAHHLLELFYSQDELKEMGRYEIVPQDRESSLYGCVPRVKIYTENTCFSNGYTEPTVEITMTRLNKQTNWSVGIESKRSFPIMKVYENMEIEKYYDNVLKPCLVELENDIKEQDK